MRIHVEDVSRPERANYAHADSTRSELNAKVSISFFPFLSSS
jgi:hypothetical protein